MNVDNIQYNCDIMNQPMSQTTCAIAQAISCWLPTVVAEVWSQDRSCGICDRLRGTGAVISKYFGFPPSNSIPPTASHLLNILSFDYIASILTVSLNE
jgi:hypothetical protein